MILCEAIRDAQSYNPEDITAGLANIKDFTGVTGKMTMGEDHNPIKSGVIMEFKEGQQVFKMRILPD
jgi:branched-chain amino acid transport system substrate-binding protein